MNPLSPLKLPGSLSGVTGTVRPAIQTPTAPVQDFTARDAFVTSTPVSAMPLSTPSSAPPPVDAPEALSAPQLKTPTSPVSVPSIFGEEFFLAGQSISAQAGFSKASEFAYTPLSFDLSQPLTSMSFDIPSVNYTDELSPLNSRYPGLSDRLKEAEARAWMVNMVNIATTGDKTACTKRVLADPPWPTTSFGSSRQKIREKALVYQTLDPKLASNRVEDYDFEKAKDRAEDLFTEMDQMFPQEEFSGAKFATRAKTPHSLENKLAKRNNEGGPEFSLAHLTDSVGARLDCTSLKMVGEAAHKLEKQYEGKIVAKDVYLSQPGALGYRALHYIVDLGDRMAEIQLSTHDLRATDLATHDTLYKPEFPVSAEAEEKLGSAADRVMEAECFRYLTGFR